MKAEHLTGPGVAILVVGVLMIAIGLYVLVKAHFSKNAIDLSHLLVDVSLEPPRVTLAKFAGMVALLVSTWIMVFITVDGKFDATAFAAYIATWGAVKVASDVVKAKE